MGWWGIAKLIEYIYIYVCFVATERSSTDDAIVKFDNFGNVDDDDDDDEVDDSGDGFVFIFDVLYINKLTLSILVCIHERTLSQDCHHCS